MRQLKNVFAGIVLLGLCGYSTWKGMQWVSILSIFLFLGVLYQGPANKLKELMLQLVKNTKQAKLGDFEVNIDEKISRLSKDVLNKSVLTQLLLTNLNSDHIGLLILIHKQGKMKPLAATKDKLRDLRSKGLLAHDKETLGESELVWLTNLGSEVASLLLNSNKDLI
jgi:hypothetical protein